jgi:hypothetical protein
MFETWHVSICSYPVPFPSSPVRHAASRHAERFLGHVFSHGTLFAWTLIPSEVLEHPILPSSPAQVQSPMAQCILIPSTSLSSAVSYSYPSLLASSSLLLLRPSSLSHPSIQTHPTVPQSYVLVPTSLLHRKAFRYHAILPFTSFRTRSLVATCPHFPIPARALGALWHVAG